MADSRSWPSLSVVIPAYNEATRITPTLTQIVEWLDSSERRYEVIVINDGSTDTTSAVVTEITGWAPHVRLHSFPENRGKGAAVREGLRLAQHERVLFMDADGSTGIDQLPRLEQALNQGADIAIGSRAVRSEDTELHALWYRKFLGRALNTLVNFLVVPGIADTQCGFKLFTAAAAKQIAHKQQLERFSFDLEQLFLARLDGLRIAEVAVTWSHVPGSKVHLLRDGIAMIRDAVWIRWLRR